MPIQNTSSIDSFLNNEFCSYVGLKEIKDDRNLITKQRYKNIFEMRKIKCDYLLNKLPSKVKNHIFIRYEDLRDHFNTTLNTISSTFNLEKTSKNYHKITNYKGKSFGGKFKQKPLKLDEKTIDYIKDHLDLNQEKKMGYDLSDLSIYKNNNSPPKKQYNDYLIWIILFFIIIIFLTIVIKMIME
jgi:hypothetical protein